MFKYDFFCGDCEEVFELSLPHMFDRETTKVTCPKCNGNNVVKLMTATSSISVVYNGKGFYTTDNRKEK